MRTVILCGLSAAAGAAAATAFERRRNAARVAAPEPVTCPAPAATQADAPPAPRNQPVAETRTWVRVGTDASLGGSGKVRGSGIAYIAENGRHGSQFVKQVRDITSAELLAVLTAVDKLHSDARGRPQNVHVLTDSRAVIAIFDDPNKAPPQYRLRVQTLVRLRERGELEITWVKGHAGHPLNEGADRLARDVRRCKQQGIGDRAQVRANIVEDTLVALKKLTSS